MRVRCRAAVEALRILLARALLDDVGKRLDLDHAWEAMKEPNTHTAGITLLARSAHAHTHTHTHTHTHKHKHTETLHVHRQGHTHLKIFTRL